MYVYTRYITFNILHISSLPFHAGRYVYFSPATVFGHTVFKGVIKKK